MVERGLGWLDDHFTVAENPGRSTYRMYYLYSLERVGRVLDTEFIGDHEWYPLGARALLDGQRPDGLWPDDPSEDDVRVSSSFALLFLTRATPTLAPVARHGGPGLLRTAIASPPPATVYVILDASGSMLDDMAGREKFDVARAAVADLVAALPDHAHVALRVYGHQHRAIDKGANEDTALEVPMGELDRAAFAAKLASLRPRGLTPMALSLDDAIKDLGSTVDAAHPVTVVLLTDGGEDTRPRRDPVRSAAALGQVKGITFHIVGFDIHEQDWSDQLHAMCDASGGRYWPAVDAGELQQNVRSAVLGIPRGFTVVDANGRPIDHGQFGDQRPLPEGKYTLTASYDGRPYKADFRINTDATTGVLFDATHAVPGAAEPTPARPAIARFCTTCGRPLPPGAKFCPSCGAPVPKP
jgi:Ca-activated chloride channel family protein